MSTIKKMITLGGVHFVRLVYSDFPHSYLKLVFFGNGTRGILEFRGLDAYCINGLFEMTSVQFREFAHNEGYVRKQTENSGYLTAS